MSISLSDLEVTYVPLSEIDTRSTPFQLRDFRADGTRQWMTMKTSSLHIDQIIATLKRGGEMEPIICRRNSAYDLEVIDGHHRAEAAKEAGRATVPVRELPRGISDAEALLIAWDANSKDKLPMSKCQKTEAVWRVLWESQSLRSQSVRTIVARLGHEVSTGTVHKMLKRIREMRDHQGRLPRHRDLWARVRKDGWENFESAKTGQELTQESIERHQVRFEALLKKHGGEPLEVFAGFERAFQGTFKVNTITYSIDGLTSEDLFQGIEFEEDEELPTSCSADY